MSEADRQWLLEHLAAQAQYVAALTRYAREHPEDADVLLRVRDEVFTLRETLETLEVPAAVVSNEQWQPMAAAPHDDRWPSADA